MTNIIRYSLRAACAIACLATSSLFCQEADDDTDAQTGTTATAAAQGSQAEHAKVVQVGEARVEFLWTADPTGYFGEDGVGRFRAFMHGVTDEEAKLLDWRDVLPYEQQRQWLSGVRVRNELMSSDLYSVRLTAGKTVTIPTPIVPIREFTGRNGSILRFFIWMKGEDTGKGGTLWESAPSVTLAIQGTNSAVPIVQHCIFKTRGTFPWHCYHVDLLVPANLTLTGEEPENAGLIVTLSNPTSGTAYFANASYRFLPREDSSYLLGDVPIDWMDPKSGSFAPNPDYDELPMHVFFGVPREVGQKWNFLDGNHGSRSITQNYDVRTYIEANANDWFHAQYVFPQLIYLAQSGKDGDFLPPMEPGWADAVSEKLLSMQDTKTGTWNIGGTPNLALTYAIVTKAFSPKSQARFDEEPAPTAWYAAGEADLPYATALAEAILAEQQKDGEEVAGWNRYTFYGKEMRAVTRNQRPFELVYSAMAAKLLMACRPYVGNALATRIDKAVMEAYFYALNHVMNAQGNLCEDDTKAKPCYDAWGFIFLDATQAFECRTSPGMAITQASLTVDSSGDATVATGTFPQEAASIRIYELAKEDNDGADLTDKALLAILAPKAKSTVDSDPLIVLSQFAKAQNRPGAILTMTPVMAGTVYTSDKLARLDNVRTAEVIKERAQFMMPKRCRGKKLALVFCDNYGNHSTPQIVDVPK